MIYASLSIKVDVRIQRSWLQNEVGAVDCLLTAFLNHARQARPFRLLYHPVLRTVGFGLPPFH